MNNLFTNISNSLMRFFHKKETAIDLLSKERKDKIRQEVNYHLECFFRECGDRDDIDIFKALERMDIDVYLTDSRHYRCYIKNKRNTRCFFVNEFIPFLNKREALAILMGHYVLHYSLMLGRGKKASFIYRLIDFFEYEKCKDICKIEAQYFASLLLMPDCMIENDFKDRDITVDKLKYTYCVGQRIAEFRIKNLSWGAHQ